MHRARGKQPLALHTPAEEHLPHLLAWLNDPVVAAPLDVRPPVRIEDLRARALPGFNTRGEAIREPVRLYSLVDAEGGLLGLTLSYGWDRSDDVIREVDLAIPHSGELPPRVLLEAMVRIVERAIVGEGATEVRARVRTGPQGEGYGRLFMAVGAHEVHRPPQRNAVTGGTEHKVLYALSPADFYASRAAQRYGARRP